MKYTRDGTPISSNSIQSNLNKSYLSGEDISKVYNILGKDTEIHVGSIQEVYYRDDKKNISRRHTEYKIIIEYGPRNGQTFENVYFRDIFGGMYNFSEVILQPKDKKLTESKNKKDFKYMTTHDASQVIIAFIHGDSRMPFIIGLWRNTNIPEYFMAKREDGIRSFKEFNGVREVINDDGEYKLSYHGGKRSIDREIVEKEIPFYETERPETGPFDVCIDKDGGLTIHDKQNQFITMSQKDGKIEFIQKTGQRPNDKHPLSEEEKEEEPTNINLISMDKNNNSIDIKTRSNDEDVVGIKIDGNTEGIDVIFKSGLTVNLSGQNDSVDVQTSGGAKVKIDGNSDKVRFEDNSGATVDLSAGKIAIGDSSTELLEQISEELDKIATWAETVGAMHTHIGNLGYDTAPPTQTSDYITLSTDLKSIKSKIDGIKGSV